jgi:hypothetical protein
MTGSSVRTLRTRDSARTLVVSNRPRSFLWTHQTNRRRPQTSRTPLEAPHEELGQSIQMTLTLSGQVYKMLQLSLPPNMHRTDREICHK